MNEPERTCVGCRQTAPASTLLRLVASESGVVVDERRRLPGRGAWLHPSAACLEQALKRRAITRALRGAQPDADALRRLLTSGR